MTWRVLVASFALSGLALVGCSSSAEDTPVPRAPRLTELAPMPGAIHVTWVNEETNCDTVEIERKKGAEAFAVVYSVPGAADNKHDANATEHVPYTYRLRCKKGASYSPYSNTLDGTPG